MAEKSIKNQTIALAGIFQAAEQVQELAWQGRHADSLLKQCVQSILCTNPSSVEDVYDGIHNLSRGFKLLQQQLGGQMAGRKIEITRHVATLMQLERRLSENASALQKVQSELARIQSRYESALAQEAEEYDDEFEEDEEDSFSASHISNPLDDAIDDIARLYKDIISPLGNKVIVQGEQRFLADEYKAKLIRVFLMAALRSVVLWSQCGGNRFKIIWHRNKHIECAKSMTEWKH